MQYIKRTLLLLATATATMAYFYSYGNGGQSDSRSDSTIPGLTFAHNGFSFSPDLHVAAGEGQPFYNGQIALLQYVGFHAEPGSHISKITATYEGTVGATGQGYYNVQSNFDQMRVQGDRFTWTTTLSDWAGSDTVGKLLDFHAFVFADGAPGPYADHLGTAYLNLDRVTVQASVAAVPEPETYAMFAAGLCGIAAALKRQRSRKEARPSA
jgi:PEP-CTERM motif-containing protein